MSNVVTMEGEQVYKKAVDLLLEGKDIPQAMHMFNLLFNHTINDENYIEVIMFHIGSCAQKMGYHGLALLLFKQCLLIKPEFPEAYNNIGCIYKSSQKDELAREHFSKAFDLACKQPDKNRDRDRAEYAMNVGSMYIANGTPLKALEYFDKADKIDSTLGMTKWNRSLANLELGNYGIGFDDYDYGERQTERIINRDYGIKDLPFWDGKSDKSKTIVVIGEQGIGDEIMFASMITDMMKDATVILEAHPRLADLFRINFPDIAVYGTRKEASMMWPNFHKIDGRIGIGSLGKFYRRSKESFPKTPYLKADPIRVEKYRKKLDSMGSRLKVGISWRGGNQDTGKINRYIPLEKLLPILRLNCDFISLQYDKGIGKKIEEFEKANNVCLNHWQDTIDNYDETAGLVSNLDLIISVPQSVVNLAGALGTKVWQLSPFKALWQVGTYNHDSDWYGCVENIWQNESCEWQPVLKKVEEKLCNLLQTNTGN